MELLDYVGISRYHDDISPATFPTPPTPLGNCPRIGHRAQATGFGRTGRRHECHRKSRINRLLRKIGEDGVTILIIEHDVKLVCLCDELTVLDCLAKSWHKACLKKYAATPKSSKPIFRRISLMADSKQTRITEHQRLACFLWRH